jgi:hypothetical protein
MSSDLIGGYLTFYLNQPIKWADFRLDALLADTMLTKLYTTGPKINRNSLLEGKRRYKEKCREKKKQKGEREEKEMK